MPEKIIGEFELYTEKLIGKGAWGEVFHGRQKSLNRPVAIKILKKELTQDAEFVKRFRRESETLAKLSDDHIVHVYSAGEFEGSYYFIMEYIQGKPLSEFIEQGHKFPLEELIYVAESVTQALKTAWESPAKIVHRDIKPSNIMVAYGDSQIRQNAADNILQSKIKVMDFGLAKVSEGGKDATMTGTIIGTPKYISPEQGLGHSVDIRSDIYSLGIIMYEIATGRIPFESETAISMIRHHIQDTVIAPRQFNPDIPSELESIILKCIQKEPEKRYANPQQLMEDLIAFRQKRIPIHATGSVLEATMLSASTLARQGKRKIIYGSIAAVIIIAILVSYLFIFKRDKTLPGAPDNQSKTADANQQNINQTNTSVVIKEEPVKVEPVKTEPVIEETKEFTAKIWTNKDKDAIYKEGEVIKFYFKVNRNSYIYVYHMDAGGHVKMLFPNGFSKKNYIEANKTYVIPDESMNFDIKVSAPFGTEQVKAVASLQPIKEMDIKDGESGFRDLGIVKDINENKFITRSLDIVPQEARTENTCTITTTKE